MYRFAKLLPILTFLSSLFAQSQANKEAQYIATKETTLTSAAEKVTVQQPITGAKVVIFRYAKVYCSVACVATLSFNGTAATTTTLAPVALNHTAAGTAVAFSSSNAGAGTTVDVYRVPAGEYVIDLSDFYMDATGTAYNLSIGTDSITGTARITIKYLEK